MNSWVLAKDLPRIAERSGDPDVAELCKIVEDNYKYPVDSVLISSELELLGHRNVSEATGKGPKSYQQFLERALAKDRGEAWEDEPEPPAPKAPTGNPSLRRLVLTKEKPESRLLDVFRSKGGPGKQFSGFYEIDASQFEQGGTLELLLTVGSSESPGSFELCELRQLSEDQFVFTPVEFATNVAPGSTKTIRYTFSKGQVFHLGVLGEGEPESTNAFLIEAQIHDDI